MEAVFLKVLSMSLTADIVIAVIILLRLPLKKAPKIFSCLLWWAALFRLLCPLSFELPAAPITSVNVGTEYVYQPDGGYTPFPADMGYTRAVPSESVGTERIGTAENGSNVLPRAGAYIWLIGAAAMLTRGVIQWIKLRRRLRCAVTHEGICVSSAIDTPFIMGILRPRIYLPEGLDGNTSSLIILHERTHLKRGDHITKLIMYAALCIHWFNPLVWVMFRLYEQDMEMSCDESAAAKMSPKQRADYSQALLDISATRIGRAASFTARFGESGTKKRVKNVLGFRRPALWVTVLCAAVIVTAAVILSADRPKDESGKEPPTLLIPDNASSQFPSGICAEAAGCNWNYGGKSYVRGPVSPLDLLKSGDIPSSSFFMGLVHINFAGEYPDTVILRGYDTEMTEEKFYAEPTRVTDGFFGPVTLESHTLYLLTALWGNGNRAEYFFCTEHVNSPAAADKKDAPTGLQGLLSGLADRDYDRVQVKCGGSEGSSPYWKLLAMAISETTFTRVPYEDITEITQDSAESGGDALLYFGGGYHEDMFTVFRLGDRYFIDIAMTNSYHIYEMNADDYARIEKEYSKILKG